MTSQPPPDLISLDQLSHLFNRYAAIGLNVKGNTQLESLACKHQSFSMSCSCSCQGKIVSTTFASWRDYGRVVGAPWSCLQNQNPGRIQTQPGNYPNDFRRSKNWGWGCLSGWGNWGYKATNTSCAVCAFWFGECFAVSLTSNDRILDPDPDFYCQEADVLQIFEGCLDAALLLARPMRRQVSKARTVKILDLENSKSINTGKCRNLIGSHSGSAEKHVDLYWYRCRCRSCMILYIDI